MTRFIYNNNIPGHLHTIAYLKVISMNNPAIIATYLVNISEPFLNVSECFLPCDVINQNYSLQKTGN